MLQTQMSGRTEAADAVDQDAGDAGFPLLRGHAGQDGLISLHGTSASVQLSGGRQKPCRSRSAGTGMLRCVIIMFLSGRGFHCDSKVLLHKPRPSGG